MTEQRKVQAAFADVAKDLLAKDGARLSEAEQREIEAEAEEEILGEPSALQRKADNPVSESGAPAWAKVPSNLVIPPWKQIGYVRFKPSLTERPDLGERMCITWGLSVVDERLARQAARGESTRMYEELAKRMIRSVDGHKADWTGKNGEGSVNRFWEEIGPKSRAFLINQYLQTHTPTVEETADFFLDCCTYRTSVVG